MSYARSASLRPAAFLLGTCIIQLMTAGCGTTPSKPKGGIDPADYRNLQEPGDCFQMFHDAIPMKEHKAAWGLLSDRLRKEVSYSEFVTGVKSDRAKPFIDMLSSAEYIRAYYTNAEQTGATMILKSGDRTEDVPMIFEHNQWHFDVDLDRLQGAEESS